MKNIIYGLIAVVLLGCWLYMLSIGVNKTEYNECLKWQSQNETIDSFYLVEWQVSQCENYNIIIE